MRPIAPFLAIAALALIPARADAWTWPVRGEVLTPFDFEPGSYARGRHRGIDIAVPPGTAVRAARGGSVAFAGVAGSNGLTVSVLTTGGRLRTTYLHLGQASVARGERVREGEAIGRSGTSGRGSAAAPHLHFGIRRDADRDGYIDPLALLPPVGVPRVAPPPPAPVLAPRPVPARRPAAPGPGRTFDAGWAVACLALLAAATALGRRASGPLRTPARGCPGVAPQPAVSSIGRRWPTTSQPRSTT